MSTLTLQHALYIAGLAQVALVAGSLAIPKVLNWKAELAGLAPLSRQMFWTYAAYIFTINLCFGLVSIFDYRELLDGSHLSMLVNGFIATYWISRVLIQFFYFDRAGFPTGAWYKLGEGILVTLFVFLSFVYGWAFIVNYQHL